jgi:muramoyltetrapeptide carboxypeptidase
MNKNSWTFLKPNDNVDIIAPASKSSQVNLEDGLQWIRASGLIPQVPKDIIKTDVFFSAPLEVQLKHLKDALYSDSRAIWCLRGGYGSMRLIPHLLKLRPPKIPKLFIGFSDITSLHLFLTQKWNWPVIHGRTLNQMHPDLKNSPDRKFLRDIIFGTKTKITFKKLKPLNAQALEYQNISAPLTGGNLRIIQSSLGTPWEIKTNGKILFIEDVAERGYSIDRMLEQMIQAKIINNKIKAVIFGDFTEGLEKDGKNLTGLAMERFAQRVSFPVLRGLPAGHGELLNYPVPFNTHSTLTLGKSGELTCDYGGKA